MDTEKLTTRSRDAVSAALRNALTNGNPSAEPVHLLHALLLVLDNSVAPLLAEVGADAGQIEQAGRGRRRQREAQHLGAEPVQQQPQPGALEAGVAGQQHSLVAPEGRLRACAHAHVFQGALPEAHRSSR